MATKAPLASPTLTGTPAAPTASTGTNTTQIATTAFVQANKFSGAFSDLSGKPTTIAGYGITDAFDGAFSSLSGKPTTIAGYGITDAFGGAFSDLSGKPTTIAGYGITNALTTGADADIGSNDFITTGKVYFANMFSQVANLPSATTYHGMFAHVHATGAAYFAHGGNWVRLANQSEVFSGAFSALTGKPTTLTGYGITDAAPLASPTFTGTPSGPTATSGTNTTQFATTAFVQSAISGFSAGANVSVSGSAPSSPSAGDLWFDDDALVLYVYYADGSSNQWVQTNPSVGGITSAEEKYKEKTNNYVAVAGEKLIVDTSSAVTITLPATAAIGDEIRIIDGTGNAATNNITVARNGHKIEGATSNLIIDLNRAAFGLVFYNAAQGWLLTER